MSKWGERVSLHTQIDWFWERLQIRLVLYLTTFICG
jgi:hypothetical protein